MGDIGLPELVVVLVIAMVIFGPGKLPDFGKALGQALRAFKKALYQPNAPTERREEKEIDPFRR
jgi:sec-independent protein translocase protein TatA